MSWTRPREINLSRLCRRRQREKLRSLKDSLEADEWRINKWEDSAGLDHEPFPVGSFERLRSNNVWEKVSEYLTNPTDITNADLACPDIFPEKRMLASLPEALRIMRSQLEEDGSPKINYLGFRGVSKAWKKIFDEEVFESDFSCRSWYTMNVNLSDNDSNPDVCQFKNLKSVETALASFSLPAGCQRRQADFPMIRKLCVDTSQITDDAEADAFRNKVTNFLELFGKSVWLLKYKSRWSPNPASQYLPLDGGYERICEMVKLTPNLKALILEGVRKESDGKLTDSEVVAENDRLKEHIMESPFPSLSSLEFFHFDATDSALILAEIYRKCKNLKSVTSTLPHYITDNDEVAEALGSLKLERYSDVDDELILWLSEETFYWPLRKLTIWMSDLEFSTTSLLWRFLNQFSSTLEFLQLDVPVEKDETNLRLNLPHLKCLVMDSITTQNQYRSTIGFDDLLPLESLQKLMVYGDLKTSRTDSNAQIYVIKLEGKVLQTNIWNCFQELKEFTFIWDRNMETYQRPVSSSSCQTAVEMEDH